MEASHNQIPKQCRKRNDKGRRSWSRREEEVLVASLKEIVSSGWKSENGFKIGYLQALEQEMMKVLPGTDLRGIPHINSKIHVWKKDYGSLVSMLSRSGIWWNDNTKMIEAHDEAWAEYVKVDSNARLMRFKTWPFYNDWVNIFGKDRATGEHAIGFIEAGSTMSLMEIAPKRKSPLIFLETCLKSLRKKSETNYVNVSMRQPRSYGRANGHLLPNTDALDFEIAKRIGYEYDISTARKEVFGLVAMMQGLSLQEKLLVSKLLVKNTEDLELFFSLPDEAKIEFAKMKLAGNL
ncbi:hypothetical protein DH2020_000881 [Rehmannia glutinosa]|uniref:Myb/SANT-like domain-containing protein n=1 Tax=Rehmannia glutinosa TaxID=99300 RepID=A0ABR0XXR0_REHGL